MSLSKSISARINKQPFGWNTNPPEQEKEYYYRSIFTEHFLSDSAARSVPSEASVACSTGNTWCTWLPVVSFRARLQVLSEQSLNGE